MGTAVSPDRSVSALRRDLLWYLEIAVVVAIIAVMYGWVLADLAKDWWNEPALSQGMLIPPFAAYIAWLRRQVTLAHPPLTDNRGLLLIACACGAYILGKLAAEFFLMRISFVLLLVGLVWTFWGFARMRSLAFPFLLLATMVPLPAIVYNSLAAPLQLFASNVAAQLAQLLGVTIYRDGNIIHLATMSLGVVEACSGLNSLSALVVASLLLAYLVCSRLPAQILLVLLSIPLAIAVNILRVTGTALIADYSQDFAEGFYHSFSGWLVFVVGFGTLYLFAKGLHFLFESKR